MLSDYSHSITLRKHTNVRRNVPTEEKKVLYKKQINYQTKQISASYVMDLEPLWRVKIPLELVADHFLPCDATNPVFLATLITMFTAVPTPSQINVIHTTPHHLFKIHFNIITTATTSSPRCLFYWGFLVSIFTHFSSLNARHIYPKLFDHPHNIFPHYHCEHRWAGIAQSVQPTR